MTKDEILKMALDALERLDGWLALRYGSGLTPEEKQTVTFIKEALAQSEQEPVAVKHMMEWIEYLKRKSDYGQHMQIPSEMSAGACWELAIELEQFINTTPPQRKPLTDELYNELLFAVGNKYPNETRHQTALRYIQQAEMKSNQPAKAAHGIKE